MRKKLKQLFEQFVPTGSVLQRTVKSGIWATLTNVSGRLLQVLMLIVLARVLTPAQFGLMGIALLLLSVSKRFTNIGINAALIRKAETDIDEYLNTTWLIEIARGLLILGVLFSFQFIGIDLSGLTVIFGLLSVGIGFGLQNLTSNFISGIILLFERPISVGDRIMVDDVEGDVQEINIRSTTINSIDNISIMSPNATTTANNVTYWMGRDKFYIYNFFRAPV